MGVIEEKKKILGAALPRIFFMYTKNSGNMHKKNTKGERKNDR